MKNGRRVKNGRLGEEGETTERLRRRGEDAGEWMTRRRRRVVDHGGWVVVGTADRRRRRRRRRRFSARGRRMRLGAGRTGKPGRESREEVRRRLHEMIRGVRRLRRRRRRFVGSVDDAGVDARGSAAEDADGRRRPSEREREEDAGGEVVQPRERAVGDKTRAVAVDLVLGQAPVGTRIERKRSDFRR